MNVSLILSALPTLINKSAIYAAKAFTDADEMCFITAAAMMDDGVNKN